MILADVRDAMVEAVRSRLGEELMTFAVMPDTFNPPMWTPGTVENLAYHQTMGKQTALVAARFRSLLFVSRGHDIARQAELEAWISDEGDQSLVQALEADVTLGGVVQSIICQTVRSNLLFTVGSNQFYGAEMIVSVAG